MASNADVIRQLWKEFDRDGVETMRRFHTPDYVRHGSDKDYTLDEWISVLQDMLTAFPDKTSHVDETVSEGDRVAYRWHADGTHQTSYMGVPATGKKIRAEGITVTLFKDGLIHEEWASWNRSIVLGSLGVIPIA